MKTLKQKAWADGRYLPPKQKLYTNIKDYITDIYLPLKVIESYRESIGKRGY